MDLFDLMNQGREDKALDRLEAMLAQYLCDDATEQGEALERAYLFCEREWGSYEAGIEALVRRWQRRPGDIGGVVTLELLQGEALEPGRIIRAHREGVGAVDRAAREREALLASYEAEAGRPPPIGAAAAKAECLIWEQRHSAVEALPEVCLQRLVAVLALWREGAAVADTADFTARLEYWAERGGGDGAGYARLLADFTSLGAALDARAPVVPAGRGSRERARQIKALHPEWSLARIGRELGISRQAVHKHLKD